jgi:hypothetical protein
VIGGASIFNMRRCVFWKSTLHREWAANKPGLTGFFAVPYTQIEARFADSPPSSFDWNESLIARKYNGRLAQLVRAPALQAGGRRFESCTAHHSPCRTKRESAVG